MDPKPELGTLFGVQQQTTDSDYATDGNNYQTGKYDCTGSGSGLAGPRQSGHSYNVPRSTGLDTDKVYQKQDTISSLIGSNTQTGFTGSNSTARVSTRILMNEIDFIRTLQLAILPVRLALAMSRRTKTNERRR